MSLPEEEEADNVVPWTHRDKPDFWMEKAWLLLMELSQHPVYGKHASVVIVSACREMVCPLTFPMTSACFWVLLKA